MSINLLQNLNDEELIEVIRSTPAVYDRKSSGFKLRDLKYRAWLEISRRIPGCSLEEIQHRWKHLRERYSKEKKSLQLLGDDTKKSSWPYFDLLTFLDPYILQRRRLPKRRSTTTTSGSQNHVPCPDDTFNDTDDSASSFSMKIEHMNEHSETEKNDDSDSGNVEFDMISFKEPAIMSLDDDEEILNGNHTYAQKSDDRPSNKKMRFSSKDISTNESEDVSTALLLNVSNMMSDVTKALTEHRKKAKKDEDEVFGELITVTLRNFKSSQKKNQLKKEIIDKLLNFSDADC